MNSNVDLFSYPSHRRRLYLREEFVGICAFAPTPHCAGMLLGVFVRWTEYRYDEFQKAMAGVRQSRGATPEYNPWIYMSATALTRELMYMYSERTIKVTLQWLVDQKYLSRRNNPSVGYDRTYQYRVHRTRVQYAIDVYAQLELYFDPPERTPIVQNYTMHRAKLRHASRKIARAIPQGTAQGATQGEDAARIDAVIQSPYYKAHVGVAWTEQRPTGANVDKYEAAIAALQRANVTPEQAVSYAKKRIADRGEYRFAWYAEDALKIGVASKPRMAFSFPTFQLGAPKWEADGDES